MLGTQTGPAERSRERRQNGVLICAMDLEEKRTKKHCVDEQGRRDDCTFSITHEKFEFVPFRDIAPRPNGGPYFVECAQITPVAAKTMSVLVPVYNEEYYCLERTLRSINQSKGLHAVCDIHVCVVLDGLDHVSSSLRDFVAAHFGGFPTPSTDVQTWIVTRQSDDLFPELKSLSVVLKRHNHKKINSHKWGFLAHARDMSADYVFATDCGTIYDPDCISILLRYLESHSDASSVTGFQRYMSHEQQRSPDEPAESFGSLRWALRAVQHCNFELLMVTRCPAYNLCGFVPVIPGPCGLFRYSALQGACLEQYFSIVEPSSGSLLEKNLCLAEDRVLSITAVFNKDAVPGTYSYWCPDAVFRCEAELSLDALVKQRRRWSNGGLAQHVYLLYQVRDLIWSTQLRVNHKIRAIFLESYILAGECFAALGPGFLAVTISHIARDVYGDDTRASLFLSCVYLMVHTIFVAAHIHNAFVASAWWMMIAINALAIVVIACYAVQNILTGQTGGLVWLLPTPVCVIMLAALHSRETLVHICRTGITFLLFLPTVFSSTFAYGLARVTDVTWGNRPDAYAQDAAASFRFAWAVNVVLLASNWFVAIIITDRGIDRKALLIVLVALVGFQGCLMLSCIPVLLRQRLANACEPNRRQRHGAAGDKRGLSSGALGSTLTGDSMRSNSSGIEITERTARGENPAYSSTDGGFVAPAAAFPSATEPGLNRNPLGLEQSALDVLAAAHAGETSASGLPEHSEQNS